MKLSLSRGARVAAGLLAGACAAAALAAPATPSKSAKPAAKPAVSKTSGVQVPIEYHKLDNGLKVVLSPDHSSPKAVIAVYYGIGFRIEPKDRARTSSST
jgi:hypothetical protein